MRKKLIKFFETKVVSALLTSTMIFTGVTGLLPVRSLAADRIGGKQFYHKHCEECKVTEYKKMDSTKEGRLWTTSETTCWQCGGALHYYRFDCVCSCGKEWHTTGYACINSPYGSNKGSCGVYSVIDCSTKHNHPTTTYGCGRTEESVIGEVNVYQNTSNPVQEKTLTADSSGFSPEMSWNNGGGSSLTVSENGTYRLNISYVDEGTSYSDYIDVTVTGIDKTAPVIDGFSPSITEPTSGSVTLKVSAHDDCGLPEKPYSYNGGEFTSSDSFTVEKNGEVTVTVRDIAGNTSGTSYTVSNIDNKAPSVTIVSRTAKWTKGECVLEIKGSDSESGLADSPYSWDGGKTWGKENTKSFTEEGIVAGAVRDKAGNVASTKYELKKSKENKNKGDGGSGGNGNQNPGNNENPPNNEQPKTEENNVNHNTETKKESKKDTVTKETKEPEEKIRETPVPQTSEKVKTVQSNLHFDSAKDKEVKEVIKDTEPEEVRAVPDTKLEIKKKLGIGLAGLLGILLLLFAIWVICMTAEVCFVDLKGNEHSLGRTLIGFKQGRAYIKLSAKMIENSESRNLRIKLPELFFAIFAGKEILVNMYGRVTKCFIERKINIALRN